MVSTADFMYSHVLCSVMFGVTLLPPLECWEVTLDVEQE